MRATQRPSTVHQLAHTAIHEAYRALSIVLLGGRVTRCTIVDHHVPHDTDEHAGETAWLSGTLTAGAEREVSWSGAVGESVWMHGRHVGNAKLDDYLTTTGRFDLARIAAADPLGRRFTEAGPQALVSALAALRPQARAWQPVSSSRGPSLTGRCPKCWVCRW